MSRRQNGFTTNRTDEEESERSVFKREKERAEIQSKVSLLPGYPTDLSAGTFKIENEDHTLGNALRYMIMKNPSVEFCGYSAPHPSEPNIHLRIQMLNNTGPNILETLERGLNDLEAMTRVVKEAYLEDLAQENFEKFTSKPDLDMEAIRAQGEETRARLRQNL